MKKITYLLFVISFILFSNSCSKDEHNLLLPGINEDLELSLKQDIVDKYIVVLKSEFALQSGITNGMSYLHRNDQLGSFIRQYLSKSGLETVTPEFVYSTALYGFSAHIPKGLLDKLTYDDNVLYIEADQIVSLGKKGGGGGGKGKGDKGPAQETPWGITRVGDAATYNGSHVAWIIDSGIDFKHPDLNVDQSRSETFVTTGKDAKSAKDLHGHGTHVAGIIAAKDNNIGVVGVAAGATVIAVKVLNSQGIGTSSGAIAGVDYVAANASAGDVANMSLGGPADKALDEAVIAASGKKGIYFVLAAGNDGDDANNYSPARVNGDYIYTVSAMDKQDNFAYFSNYSNPPVDYCAPGVGIYSTYKGGGYSTMNGTSMAAPHVAGLILSTAGNLKTDGTVNNDPDNTADPIAVR